MRLIGLRCKHGDMFSLQVLIGRGLDLLLELLNSHLLYFLCSILRMLISLILVGVNGYEVPPVPIPNTEVKLIHVENTWLVTAREFRSVPASTKQQGAFLAASFIFYGPLAQSVRAPGS